MTLGESLMRKLSQAEDDPLEAIKTQQEKPLQSMVLWFLKSTENSDDGGREH